jgi:hypothetical protein
MMLTPLPEQTFWYYHTLMRFATLSAPFPLSLRRAICPIAHIARGKKSTIHPSRVLKMSNQVLKTTKQRLFLSIPGPFLYHLCQQNETCPSPHYLHKAKNRPKMSKKPDKIGHFAPRPPDAFRTPPC